MTEEEAVNIFDLVVKSGGLPATMDKLVPLSFIGSAAVKFYQAKVKLMDQLGMSEAQRKATLSDGQDAGVMLLDIEARIGELAIQEPQVYAAKGKSTKRGSAPSVEPPKHERLGIPSETRMKSAEAIHRNPSAVAAVIKEAKANEDIPTKTAVLNKIALDKERVRREASEARGKPALVVTLEQGSYINALERIIVLLPQKPPKDWSEAGLKRAQGLVKIILKRLEVFDGKERKNITD